MRAKVKLVFVTLRLLGARKVLRLARDFQSTFDSEFYRNVSNSIFGMFLPRLHYFFIGQFIGLAPNRFFDHSEYSSLLPKTELRRNFAYLHYLLRSSGRRPTTTWDLGYLKFTPEAHSYDRSLILHAFLYNKNMSKESLGAMGSLKNLESDPISRRRIELQLISTISCETSASSEIDLEIIINSCSTTIVPPSVFFQESEIFRVTTTRMIHIHETVSIGQDPKVELLNSQKVIITIHNPALLNLDLIIGIFRETHDSADIESRILDVLRSSTRNGAYSNTQLFLSYSSFHLKIEEIDSDLSIWGDDYPILISNEIQVKRECKRILLISHEDSHTGAPIYLKQLAKVLSDNGYEIHVLCLRENFRNGNFEDLNCSVSFLEDYREKRFSNSEMMQGWLLNESGDQALNAAINSFKPDLIFANTLCSSDSIRVAHANGLPSILYVHESWSFDGPDWTTKDYFQLRVRESLETANIVLFGSRSTQRHWQDSQFMFNGFSVPSYRDLEIPSEKELDNLRSQYRLKFGIPRSARVFLSIATFEPRKRIEDIILAFNMLSDANSYLILVGASHLSSNQKIEDCIQGNSQIKVVKSTKKLDGFYASSDFFVFASEEETMPLVLQEAALYKMPRIVSSYSGVQELIPTEEYGLLFPIRDVIALKSKMRELLDSPKSSREMSLRAFGLQQAFSTRGNDEVIKNIESLFLTRTSILWGEPNHEKN